jgi:hypothetical protein
MDENLSDISWPDSQLVRVPLRQREDLGSIPVAGFKFSNRLIFVFGVISSSNILDTNGGMKGLALKNNKIHFQQQKLL